MPFKGIYIGAKVSSELVSEPVEGRIERFIIYGAYESEENKDDCFLIEYSREGNKVGRTTMIYENYEKEIKNKVLSYFNLETPRHEDLNINIAAYNDRAPVFIAPDY